MRKASILIIFAGLFALIHVRHISGLCMTPGPPCEEFWRANAVFAGRVISVTNDTENINSKEPIQLDASQAVHVVFAVSEPFRGISESRIEVRTGSRGPRIWVSNSIDFRVGQEYIVYAYRQTSQAYLSTSECTRTCLIANGTEDLAYARSVATNTATGARIFGNVFSPITQKPISGISISLLLGQKSWKTKTNSEGDFVFTGKPVGDYQVLLPGGMQISTSVLDVRGCACVGKIPIKLDR